MRITNKLNLPQPLVDAVKNDGYKKGDCDISVTGLLEPPQITQLKKRHDDEITEDASDRIWSLLGQVVHGVLERAESSAIAERRLFISVAGWKIGGQMDRFVHKEGLLQDYKFVSVYKVKNGVPEEYAKQLNIYAHILRENGDKVNALQIVAILRDWSKLEADRDPDYPQQGVMILDVPLIEPSEVQTFLEERVALHKQAFSSLDKDLPPCSNEDRWAKPTQWAIMKPGAKRAQRLCNTKEAAEMVLTSGQYIQERPGVSTRCEHYCPVKNFCNQYKTMKEKENKDE